MNAFIKLITEQDSEWKIHEIKVSMENDINTYRWIESYFATIYKKEKKGQFDLDLACKGFDRIVQDFINKVYNVKFAWDGKIKLTPAERKEVAKEFLKYDYQDYKDNL